MRRQKLVKMGLMGQEILVPMSTENSSKEFCERRNQKVLFVCLGDGEFRENHFLYKW